MAVAEDPPLPRYRLPDTPGPEPPLPAGLDTPAGWQARARLVRPDLAPQGLVRSGGRWEPVYPASATVPIESGADLDATSTPPAPPPTNRGIR